MNFIYFFSQTSILTCAFFREKEKKRNEKIRDSNSRKFKIFMVRREEDVDDERDFKVRHEILLEIYLNVKV